MTIDDMLIELRIMNPVQSPVTRFEAELLERRQSSLQGPLRGGRRVLAAGLVRAGVWLDRRAGERVLTPSTH
jgi:hypothetical protein